MKTYHDQSRITKEVTTCTCNKCGEIISYNFKDGKCYGTSVTIHGGYFNKHLSDLTSYWFDICEECLVEFMNTFKIPSTSGDYCLSGGNSGESEYSQVEDIEEQVAEEDK